MASHCRLICQHPLRPVQALYRNMLGHHLIKSAAKGLAISRLLDDSATACKIESLLTQGVMRDAAVNREGYELSTYDHEEGAMRCDLRRQWNEATPTASAAAPAATTAKDPDSDQVCLG